EQLRFASQPRDAIRIGGERGRQHLDRDITVEHRVPRAIDLTHPAFAKLREDFIRAEANAWCERHGEQRDYRQMRGSNARWSCAVTWTCGDARARLRPEADSTVRASSRPNPRTEARRPGRVRAGG